MYQLFYITRSSLGLRIFPKFLTYFSENTLSGCHFLVKYPLLYWIVDRQSLHSRNYKHSFRFFTFGLNGRKWTLKVKWTSVSRSANRLNALQSGQEFLSLSTPPDLLLYSTCPLDLKKLDPCTHNTNFTITMLRSCSLRASGLLPLKTSCMICWSSLNFLSSRLYLHRDKHNIITKNSWDLIK